MDRARLKTISIHDRKALVHRDDCMRKYLPGMSMAEWIRSLPHQLAADSIRELATRVVEARKADKGILLLFGAHLVKCGLSRLAVQWMERGLVSCLATNGAGGVHDFEMAFAGKTSEDVTESIRDGSFGMCEETGRIMNQAIHAAGDQGQGLGEGLGQWIEREQYPYREDSILAAAYRQGVPLTMHVAIGTDVIHTHPSADGAAIGETSLRDYRRFEECVSGLDGGVVLLFGSAVVLPEVFLKALSVARNLGHRVENLTVANFDMIQHYRPRRNLLFRPTQTSGKAFALTGHHEIMFPLLTAAVFENLEGNI